MISGEQQQQGQQQRTPSTPSDDNYAVHQLKHDHYKDFEELIVSRLTKTLDLSDNKLDVIRGNFEATKTNHSKAAGALLAIADVTDQMASLFEHIGKHLQTEGIFRKSGTQARQRLLTSMLDARAPVDYQECGFSVHDSVGALKSYLSKLTEPLLVPSKYFEAHMQIIGLEGKSSTEERLRCLQLLLMLLPAEHLYLLHGLLRLLLKTSQPEQLNLMSAETLACVIGPTLLWPRGVDFKSIEELSKIDLVNKHVTFIIKHADVVMTCPRDVREAAGVFMHNQMWSCGQVEEGALAVPSSALKRTNSKYRREAKEETKEAMTQLREQMQQWPDSTRKKKMLGKFEKLHHQKAIAYNQDGDDDVGDDDENMPEERQSCFGKKRFSGHF